MTVVIIAEFAQSYIAQARSSGLLRPRAARARAAGVAGSAGRSVVMRSFSWGPGVRSLPRLQEGQQVSQFLSGELLVEAGGHDGDGPGPNLLDRVAREAGLLGRVHGQDHLVGRVLAEQ